MSQLTDDQLLQELRSRLDDHRHMIAKIGSLMVQLELVNKKLMDSEALKSNFLSNIRNEINNPLTAILGLAKNLTTDKDIDFAKAEAIGKAIFNESFSLQFQFENIFHAADLEAGELSLNYSKIELPHFMECMVRNFQHLLDEKEMTCTIHPGAEDVEYFQTDPDKLYMILSNLFDNAIKFSHEKSNIDLDYKFADQNIVVRVKDNGIGIPDKDRIRILGRFVQLDSGSTKQHSGHGLGLSVVTELLKLLDGEINIYSHPDQGSEFVVTIPQLVIPPEIHSLSAEGNEEFFDDGEMF